MFSVKFVKNADKVNGNVPLAPLSGEPRGYHIFNKYNR